MIEGRELEESQRIEEKGVSVGTSSKVEEEEMITGGPFGVRRRGEMRWNRWESRIDVVGTKIRKHETEGGMGEEHNGWKLGKIRKVRAPELKYTLMQDDVKVGTGEIKEGKKWKADKGVGMTWPEGYSNSGNSVPSMPKGT